MLKSILQFFGVQGDPEEFGESMVGIIEGGVFVNASKHKVVLDGGEDGKIVLRGKFDVEAGVVTDGTITGHTVFMGGERIVRASGLDVDFTEFNTGIGDESDTGAALFLLFTADQAFGSEDDDLIFAIAPRIKAGDGDDFIVSDFIDKRIKGEGGDDTIVSGSGADVLFGGGGRDVFGFREPEDGVDKIKDFRTSKDKIGLDDEGFGILGKSIDATEFVIGTEATTADQHIIYDDVSGSLFWDADGVGGEGKVKLAQLDSGLALTTASFTVDFFA